MLAEVRHQLLRVQSAYVMDISGAFFDSMIAEVNEQSEAAFSQVDTPTQKALSRRVLASTRIDNKDLYVPNVDVPRFTDQSVHRIIGKGII